MNSSSKQNLWLIILAMGFFFFGESKCNGQELQRSRPMRVAFLNCQNLFDTINAPDTNDGEFTPSGSRRWDGVKYGEKVRMLSGILKELNADILGLCEVENRAVVEDLVGASGGGYNIVHYESRDSRGIDVCLVYRPEVVEIKSSEMILEDMAPRGILKVECVVAGESAVIYVAHLPSQRGGQAASLRREGVIRALETEVGENIGGNVVVMGDMNREPIEVAGLTNLAVALEKKGMGSYCYRGVWSMLDQFLISPSLINRCQGMELNIPRAENSRERKIERGSDHFGVFFILKI